MPKRKYRIARTAGVVLIGVYSVLLIPDPAQPVPAASGEKAFVWNSEARWQALVEEFERLRGVYPDALAPEIGRVIATIDVTVDSISRGSLGPRDVTFSRLESSIFNLAPAIAHCPQQLPNFAACVSRLRSVVKMQAVDWSLADTASRNVLYRLINGGRFAVEQAMLQTPANPVPAVVVGDEERSFTPSATLLGMTIHSGDILISRGDFSVSALIARGNDYPGNFSHAAIALVDSVTHELSVLESVIEEGAHIVNAYAYLADRKQRIMVLRLRCDLPAMRADPMLPHRAAMRERDEITRHHVPYDFPMDQRDHSALSCTELIAEAFRPFGYSMWMEMSHMSRRGVIEWMSELGVRNFTLAEPSDLEYDPQLRVVAEWRSPERLSYSRLDDAVTEVMLEDADRGEKLAHQWYMLPIARVAKAYGVIQNLFGVASTIPEGMSATQALRTDAYRRLHASIREHTIMRAELVSRDQGFPTHYWQLLKIAREVKDNVDGFEGTTLTPS